MTRTPAQARAVRIEEALVDLLLALKRGPEEVQQAVLEARAALTQSAGPGQTPQSSQFILTPPGPHDPRWQVGTIVDPSRNSVLHALMRRAGVPRDAYVPRCRPDGRVLVGGYYRVTDAQMAGVRRVLAMLSPQTTLNDTD